MKKFFVVWKIRKVPSYQYNYPIFEVDKKFLLKSLEISLFAQHY